VIEINQDEHQTKDQTNIEVIDSQKKSLVEPDQEQSGNVKKIPKNNQEQENQAPHEIGNEPLGITSMNYINLSITI